MIWRILLFVLGGAVLGFGYQRLIGCRSGTCVITSNPYVSTIYGALMGYFDCIYRMEDGRLTGSSGEQGSIAGAAATDRTASDRA